MFLPHTNASKLKMRLTKMEERLKFRTRYRNIETGGRTISQSLMRKDPSAGVCGWEQCFPCQHRGGACLRPHALYCMVCIDCLELEKKAYYIWEKARAPYDRGVEHLDAIRLNNKESPLVEHGLWQHQGKKANFRMEIIRFT